jgi:cell filamentation protein
MPAEFIDPYIDPNFDVLRNLVGATTYDELANAEGEYVSSRTVELLEKKHPNLTGSLEDFKYLHHAIFKDIFDWAGEIRTVEIKKNSEGSEYFLPSSRIEQGFAWSQDQLKNDHYLQNLSKEEFLERLAFHYDNYNYIHPLQGRQWTHTTIILVTSMFK